MQSIPTIVNRLRSRFLPGKISRKVFAKLNVKKILWYMDFLKEKSPRHRPRYSQQAWLRQDKAADPILRRLLKR